MPTESRIRTTHAGSLPRPASLVALHTARFRGESLDTAAFAEAIEAAASDVLAKQLASGVDVVNDGEVGREGFFTFVQHHMTGFGGRSDRPVMRDITLYPSFMKQMLGGMASEQVSLLAPPKAIGEVAFRDLSPVREECARLTRLLAARGRTPADAFVTAPSPGIIAAAMQNEHYPSLEAYIDAVGAALALQYRAILDAGFTLQIDAPDLAMERHTLFADKPLEDFLHFARRVLAAIARALDGVAPERVRLHVCWGNYNAPHECDVPLEDIWPVLANANAGALVLSLANPRHEHEIDFFRGNVLPPHMRLIVGCIDTTTNYVEHPKVVAKRLQHAAAVIGDPARILAGTDCGFETSAGYVMVAEEVVWAKLRALAEGAALASHALYGTR